MFFIALLIGFLSPYVILLPITLYIVFKVRNREVEPLDKDMASFEIRSIAFSIDILLIELITVLLPLISISVDNIETIVLGSSIINHIILPSVYGWSLGKRIVGIKILKNKNKAGYIDIIYREVVKNVFSVALFFIGCIWMLISKKQLTWHDSVADTGVYKIKNFSQNKVGIAVFCIILD